MDAVPDSTIHAVIAAAVLAPSGDNTQPWRFVVRGDSAIEFHYLPERDHPILNHEEGGTLIALGAALLNAELEAKARGLVPHTTYRETGSCVAVVELGPGGTPDPDATALCQAIARRHSNRKAYAKTALSAEDRAAILNPQISVSPDLSFTLIESPQAMKEVARASTTMEEIALGNQRLHALFFADILWSAKENLAGAPGLYIKTLELAPPAEVLFPLLARWGVARALAILGFPRFVARSNAVQNAAAAAFGVISAKQTSRRTYLEIGRMLERIWLLATVRGLSLQVTTGITFLARAMEAPEVARLFAPRQCARAHEAYTLIKRHTGALGEPILVFRIGRGEEPTEVSHRRPPDIVFA